MTKPLSNDLRARLIDAVTQGMSCRAAADRFGVAASTAVKLVRRWRDTGTSAPRPQGGDKRSDRIEVYAGEILGLIAERFALSTIWRFLDRHAQTFKKNRARQRTGASGCGRPKAGLARGAARA